MMTAPAQRSHGGKRGRQRWLTALAALVPAMLGFLVFAPSLGYGFHLTNLLLHAAVCAALFFLLLRLGCPKTGAVFGAAWFALHPVHTEATVLLQTDARTPISAGGWMPAHSCWCWLPAIWCPVN